MSNVIKVAELLNNTLGHIPELQKAARAVRPGICSVYKSDPGWFTNFGANNRLFPQVVQATTAQMNDFCSDQPLPPPKQKEFSGGQCPKDYLLAITQTYSPKVGTPVVTNFTRTARGPIGGLGVRKLPNSNATPEQGGTQWYISAAGGDIGLANYVSLYSYSFTVTPLSGSDNCGDPLAVDPPSPISTSDRPFSITLPDPRGGNNITVPVVVAPPIIIAPSGSLNPRVSIPIKIGEINFDFSGDSITQIEPATNVTVDLSSQFNSVQTQITNTNNSIVQEINNSRTATNSNTNSSINSAITNINNSTSSALATTSTAITNSVSSSLATTSNNISNAITAINNNSAIIALDLTSKLNALGVLVAAIAPKLELALQGVLKLVARPECPESPLAPDSPNVDDIVKDEEDEKKGNNPKIQAVTIKLTRLPAKGQWGGGANIPDKQIAGWFEWKYNGWGYKSVEQINFETSTFVRPPYVSGYAYTLTNGAKGFAIEHILKEPDA
jgi:hypothetical protein